MDEQTLDILEFDRLVDVLVERAQSEPGAAFLEKVRPDLTPKQIRERWRFIDEARDALVLEGPLPLENLVDVAPLLDRIRTEGAVLRPSELVLMHRVILTSRLCRNFLAGLEENAPALHELRRNLFAFQELEQTLQRSVAADGEILDTASAELKRIRRETVGLRGSIHNRLTDLLRSPESRNAVQDDIITQRSGRYVIPVKASLRRDVPGLVHDFSSSGATAYLEPMECVEDNNRLNLMRRREKQEIERILARLTAMCAERRKDIQLATEMLAWLDGIFAMAALGRAQNAVTPQLVENGDLELVDARHPLLLARPEVGDRTVPINLKLTNNNRVLVISGINAGGKTVALKTLGLIVLMARCGLHLPVGKNSVLPHFDQVLAVMGDDQSLYSDLSTFSGHISRLSHILDVTSDRSLVLLDELGKGTDPVEGAALALAVLEELRVRRAWVMTATHYHLLKTWAHVTENAGNAAVRTDREGKPVYGMDYGLPGVSAGLSMAKDMGLDPAIVSQAESYLDEGQQKTVDLMRQLERERAQLAESRATYESMEEELAAAVSRFARLDAQRREKQHQELKALRKRVNEAISRADLDFKDIRRSLKRDRPREADIVGRFRRATTELKRAAPAPPPPVMRPLEQVRPGDRVYVGSLGKVGRVAVVYEGRKKAVVDLEGMTVQAGFADLGRPDPGQQPRQSFRPTLPVFSAAPREVNLLGMTVDEALVVVDKTLDQAHLGGVKTFSIIHGIGTGRLRQAVRGFLHDDFRVESFQRGERQTGGEGVTMVELKE